MLSGELTGLRARTADDAEILHEELYEDVEDWVAGLEPALGTAGVRPGIALRGGGPGRGATRARARRRRVLDRRAGHRRAGRATVALWGIDAHNRMAHIGIELRPAFRGRGLGVDAVRVVCRYGFALRGLHRLQLETLADNHAMIAVAEKLGFTREGATRGSSWVNGRFMDDVIFGLLAEEFTG